MAKQAAREVRREAFVDAAQRLIATKGYEQMSIQDLLDELDASKGGFYHYWDSKAALLETVVERIVESAWRDVSPVLDEPGLCATERLSRLFHGIGGWKTERMDLLLGVLRVWYSDDNAIVREKVRRAGRELILPALTRIVEQGAGEGAFRARSPVAAARAAWWVIEGMQELATELFFAREAGTVSTEQVLATFDAQAEALERVLGAAPGSVNLVDAETLRAWFG